MWWWWLVEGREIVVTRWWIMLFVVVVVVTTVVMSVGELHFSDSGEEDGMLVVKLNFDFIMYNKSMMMMMMKSRNMVWGQTLRRICMNNR